MRSANKNNIKVIRAFGKDAVKLAGIMEGISYLCSSAERPWPVCLFVCLTELKMNPLELSQIADLGAAVARLTKTDLITDASVTAVANQIIVAISRFEVENRLGHLLQQIYRAVDQHFPIRKENLSLIIKDRDGSYEHCFKIWRSS
ncbi:hypothetical protein [Mucilaginibacter gynuensis]|uniref:hypothetical protein n=1 Tax=Mucilaginibacter gynuensis TaxID=1302236 RepID=UPI0031EE6F18